MPDILEVLKIPGSRARIHDGPAESSLKRAPISRPRRELRMIYSINGDMVPAAQRSREADEDWSDLQPGVSR